MEQVAPTARVSSAGHGRGVGLVVGETDGPFEGDIDGPLLGLIEGDIDGPLLGLFEGDLLGPCVGYGFGLYEMHTV